MKLLKSHGKKISVMLLVTALMLAPILRVFADDTVTCEKRFHYYFLEAEELWIETHYNTGEVKRQYTEVYRNLFGMQNAKKTGDEPYGNVDEGKNINDVQNGVWITDGNQKVDAEYVSKNSAPTYMPFLTSANTNAKKTVAFDSIFYNYELDPAYSKSNYEIKNTWTKDDWKRSIKMSIESLNVGSGNPTSSELSYEDGDDIYFLHVSWKDNNSEGAHEANSQYVQWQDSHEQSLLKDMYEGWKGKNIDTDPEVNSRIDDLMNGSYAIDTDTTLDNINSLAQNSSNMSITVSRYFNWPTSQASLKSKDVESQSGHMFFDGVEVKDKDATDYYAWILFPAMATVTFTATGDVCLTGSETTTTNTTITETSEKNPNTGIASYAIIGTLLVGAASAYIYARKNNKFNKV